jgi:hypothetical protein
MINFLFALTTVLSVTVSKATFYTVLKEGKKSELENEKRWIPPTTNINLNKAYEGALLCRKAGVETKVEKKISTFKNGAILLENAVQKDYNNIEIHFLRLIIQENSPRILNYNKNLSEDSKFIANHIDNINDNDLYFEIIKYSKKSGYLKLN